jgi:DNA-binding XRE family transcriptional regulator
MEENLQVKTLVVENLKQFKNSHANMASHFGVSRQAIWRWERGLLAPNPMQVWKMLCIVHKYRLNIVALLFDRYIRDKDLQKELQ